MSIELDSETAVPCYGTVTISDDNDNNDTTAKFVYQQSCPGSNSSQSDEGTLLLNPTVIIGGAPVTLTGIAQIVNSEGTRLPEFAFMDPQSGYYIDVSVDRGPTINIGSNKPLQ